MRKKRILICGANGFIGRNIFESLSREKDIEVLGTYHAQCSLPKDPRLLNINLTDATEVSEVTKGIDVIVQAAATTSGAKEVHTQPWYHVTDNAVMNALLFRAAHMNRVSHLLFFSCTIMYPSSTVPLKENDLDLNVSLYDKYFGAGWTKLYNEKASEFYSRLGHTKYTVIRHSNIYGPYDKFDLEKSHVLGATITKVMTTKNGKILVWGKGEEERDLLYVSDLVRFVKQAIERQKDSFGLFNVGLGKSISVTDLVKKIIEVSGRDVQIEFDETKPTLSTKIAIDISKAKRYFNWSPLISLEEGLQKTIQWYQKNYPFS